ncbi:MAG TPA: gamma-glutamyltransferase, partial [Actinomycetota bacterium]|nr:gamma-glutamyltransferase [Actinomycetota bacterium]
SHRVPREGNLLRNRALAATLRRLLQEAEGSSADRDGQLEAARNAYYRGFVAESLVRYIERAEPVDDSGRAHRGLLSGDDLWRYRATLEEPVSLPYGRYLVHKTGPWGQGPVFLQQLALLDGFGLNERRRLSAEFIHVVVECAKLAFADREAWYGDPSFVDVPISDLLGPAYASARRALVGEDSASELRPGAVDGRSPRLPRIIEGSPGPPGASTEPVWGRHRATPRQGDTCHVDAVDHEGNLVSVTPSGGWLQGSPLIPELGFPLGTRAQMFWLEEGLPNSLAPGKRPRTTLSPSLACRDGEPYLAFGTPGGDGQDQWPLLFFLNHVEFGMGLQEAIESPVFHSTHFPSSFFPRDRHPREVVMEAAIPSAVREELRRRGHRITVVPEWTQGRTTAVVREGDILRAAANPRGMQAYAGGR